MQFHALVRIGHGLNEPYDTPAQRRRASTVVPPAAQWILLAGAKIHQLCTQGEYDRDVDFNMDRWVFWMGQFREVSIVQYLAERAVSKMDHLENLVEHDCLR